MDLRAYADHLRKAGRGAGEFAGEIVEQLGDVFEAEARSRARVKTGFMRDNIEAQPVQMTGTQATVDITSAATYDVYNEWGTSRMSPQPMFRPALALVEQVANGMGTKIETALYRTLQSGENLRVR